MKTAISVPDEIFKEVDKFARDHNYSRSKVFVVAIKDFFERTKSKQLLDTLNKVYVDIESPEDIELRKKAIKHYSQKVLRERY